MALGDDVITTNTVSYFNEASGMTASSITSMIAGTTLFLVIVWAAWYVGRVYYTGFAKADSKFIITGTLLAIVMVFVVTWVVSEIQS